ncbi:hypothetical protein Pan54_05460 [Rubinisphaera italica]|uniref:Uncharacterized protein n=1 Tax=Rubinisphaera italica TaxID=2527969 RepID=A0A5C5XCE0_9PLAN|nr:hypothetical protein Pan54_05460 [Rubinisphaera italica]
MRVFVNLRMGAVPPKNDEDSTNYYDKSRFAILIKMLKYGFRSTIQEKYTCLTDLQTMNSDKRGLLREAPDIHDKG